jgi:chemotaxis methyl-accepting protein methylase
VFLAVNERIWSRLPERLTATRPMRAYGTLVHEVVKRSASRRQFFGTFFLRNRPELDQLRTLARSWHGDSMRLTILASSNGAEVYSMVWAIRSSRPDLNVVVHAVDISREILEVASRGVYSLEDPGLAYEPIFERLSGDELDAMFDRSGNEVTVKSWIRNGIQWHVGDAASPEVVDLLGQQDVVVANRFLCHMAPSDAEHCLRNVARLVAPGGYLFVSGVDLDVRTKVARELGWSPVVDRLEEIHDGDPSVRRDWPWRWWGLEPFDRNRRDWSIRYAAVFRVNRLPGPATMML